MGGNGNHGHGATKTRFVGSSIVRRRSRVPWARVGVCKCARTHAHMTYVVYAYTNVHSQRPRMSFIRYGRRRFPNGSLRWRSRSSCTHKPVKYRPSACVLVLVCACVLVFVSVCVCVHLYTHRIYRIVVRSMCATHAYELTMRTVYYCNGIQCISVNAPVRLTVVGKTKHFYEKMPVSQIRGFFEKYTDPSFFPKNKYISIVLI